MKTYFDTDVIVAYVLDSHPFHKEAERVCREIPDGVHQGYLSTHNLAEVYSTLTRIPPPLQFSGPQARQFIMQDILPYFEAVVLTPTDYMAAIDKSCEVGRAGGAIYDAIHLAAARKAECDIIYTFNIRHFRELAPDLATRIRPPQLP